MQLTLTLAIDSLQTAQQPHSPQKQRCSNVSRHIRPFSVCQHCHLHFSHFYFSCIQAYCTHLFTQLRIHYTLIRHQRTNALLLCCTALITVQFVPFLHIIVPILLQNILVMLLLLICRVVAVNGTAVDRTCTSMTL